MASSNESLKRESFTQGPSHIKRLVEGGGGFELEMALEPHATAAQRRRMLEELLEMLTQETEGGVHGAETVKEGESVF